MPELPDVTVYLERLAPRVLGQPLEHVRLQNAFILRSVTPPVSAVEGRRVMALRRLGKRIVLALDGDLFVVIHLMIAGRLRWRDREGGATGADGTKRAKSAKGAKAPKIPAKLTLASFDFPSGTLVLTEAGSTRRASLHLVEGEEALRAFDRGGLEVMDAELSAFQARLRSENHTLKRALTDPRLFSGIGNAYSDEILHRAQLSPLTLTSRLDNQEIARLFRATRETLLDWTARLRANVGDRFPEKVTAFHDDMAVHGRFGLPCPVCGTPVQRIVYAANETNYCARCQTGGKLLADRALSRLLKKDWPRTLEELEG